jgi:hypothetical protein
MSNICLSTARCYTSLQDQLHMALAAHVSDLYSMCVYIYVSTLNEPPSLVVLLLVDDVITDTGSYSHSQ